MSQIISDQTLVHEALMPYKSKVISTIHDSIVVDVHPEELDIVPKVVYDMYKLKMGVRDDRDNHS